MNFAKFLRTPFLTEQVRWLLLSTSRVIRKLLAKLNKDSVKKKQMNSMLFSRISCNREAHLLYRTKMLQFPFQLEIVRNFLKNSCSLFHLTLWYMNSRSRNTCAGDSFLINLHSLKVAATLLFYYGLFGIAFL